MTKPVRARIASIKEHLEDVNTVFNKSNPVLLHDDD
jgi:hypothetical protein